MNKFEKTLNYSLAILFGIVFGMLMLAIIDLVITPVDKRQEPACAIERNTVVYPDGENGEAKITNECLVREAK